MCSRDHRGAGEVGEAGIEAGAFCRTMSSTWGQSPCSWSSSSGSARSGWRASNSSRRNLRRREDEEPRGIESFLESPRPIATLRPVTEPAAGNVERQRTWEVSSMHIRASARAEQRRDRFRWSRSMIPPPHCGSSDSVSCPFDSGSRDRGGRIGTNPRRNFFHSRSTPEPSGLSAILSARLCRFPGIIVSVC